MRKQQRQRMLQQQLIQPSEQPKLQAATNVALALGLENAKQLKNVKKQNGNKGRKKNSNPKNGNKLGAPSTLMQCTAQYASAIADPVGTPAGACLPFGFPIPSQRVKTFTRGMFQLGTTGVGYVAARPAFGNSHNAIQWTTVTSVGTLGTDLGSFTNLGNSSLPKLPFTNAAMADGSCSARFVAGELRIRYAGTEANRNGIVTTAEHPTHGNVLAETGNEIATDTYSYRERPKPDGSWHTVKWSGPSNQTDTQFNVLTGYTNYPLLCLIVGIAADLYEYEYHQHIEYSGENIFAAQNTHDDPQGFGKALESFKHVTANSPLNDRNSPSAFSTFLSTAGSSVGKMIRDWGISTVAGMISPALIPVSRAATQLLLGN
jgi:hypothetical protein